MPLGLTRIGLSTAPRTDYFWGAAAGATTLTAGSGSFSLSGQAASLPLSRVIAASPGLRSITGQAAGFAISRKYGPLSSGSLALTGLNATFNISTAAIIVADSDSFSLSGQAASLPLSRVIAASLGLRSITGQAAGFAISRKYGPLSSGSLALTGLNATFNISTAAIIVADSGSFSLSGQAAAMSLSRLLAAEHVAHGLVASPIRFVRHLHFAAEPGSRQLAGQSANVFVDSAAGTAALYYRHFHARSITR